MRARACRCPCYTRAFSRRSSGTRSLTPCANLNISKRLYWHNPGVSSFFLEVDLPCMKLRGGCFCREFASRCTGRSRPFFLFLGNRGNEEEERGRLRSRVQPRHRDTNVTLLMDFFSFAYFPFTCSFSLKKNKEILGFFYSSIYRISMPYYGKLIWLFLQFMLDL